MPGVHTAFSQKNATNTNVQHKFEMDRRRSANLLFASTGKVCTALPVVKQLLYETDQ